MILTARTDERQGALPVIDLRDPTRTARALVAWRVAPRHTSTSAIELPIPNELKDFKKLMTKKAIVTLVVGERYQKNFKRHCYRAWKTYADLHGLDLLIIDT